METIVLSGFSTQEEVLPQTMVITNTAPTVADFGANDTTIIMDGSTFTIYELVNGVVEVKSQMPQVAPTVTSNGAVPTVADFGDDVLIIKGGDGKLYTLDDNNEVKAIDEAVVNIISLSQLPTVADFTDDIQVIKDSTSGKLYTLNASNEVVEVGDTQLSPSVVSIDGIPSPTDFTDSIVAIEDTSSGKLYTLNANSEVVEVGLTPAIEEVVTVNHIPLATDFANGAKLIIGNDNEVYVKDVNDVVSKIGDTEIPSEVAVTVGIPTLSTFSDTIVIAKDATSGKLYTLDADNNIKEIGEQTPQEIYLAKATTVPTASMFIDNLIVIEDESTGKLYTLNAGGEVVEVGVTPTIEEVTEVTTIPTVADFTEDVNIIKDTNSGKLYTLNAGGEVVEVGLTDDTIVMGTTPTVDDFTDEIDFIVDNLEGKVYILDANGVVKEVGATPIPKEVEQTDGVPTVTDFTEDVSIIKDTNSGKVYTLNADNEVVEVGLTDDTLVMTTTPIATDFTDGIDFIIDKASGKAYILDENAVVREIGVTEVPTEVGNAVGIPTADAFSDVVQIVKDVNTGKIYTLDNSNNVIEVGLTDDTLMMTTTPIATDFTNGVDFIVDKSQGKVYILDVNGIVQEIGVTEVPTEVGEKNGVPLLADFIDSIQIIKDTVSGKLYTLDSSSNVVEIGGTQEIVSITTDPTVAMFTDDVDVIVNSVSGDVFTTDANGQVVNIGKKYIPVTKLAEKVIPPLATDFTDDIKIIEDTVSGSLYTLDASGNVVEVGKQDIPKEVIAYKDGLPILADFTDDIKVILDTSTSRVWSVDTLKTKVIEHKPFSEMENYFKVNFRATNGIGATKGSNPLSLSILGGVVTHYNEVTKEFEEYIVNAEPNITFDIVAPTEVVATAQIDVKKDTWVSDADNLLTITGNDASALELWLDYKNGDYYLLLGQAKYTSKRVALTRYFTEVKRLPADFTSYFMKIATILVEQDDVELDDAYIINASNTAMNDVSSPLNSEGYGKILLEDEPLIALWNNDETSLVHTGLDIYGKNKFGKYKVSPQNDIYIIDDVFVVDDKLTPQGDDNQVIVKSGQILKPRCSTMQIDINSIVLEVGASIILD